MTHRIKAVPNDQCGSVRKVLSVRRRRPRFARPPIGFGSSSLGKRTGRDLLTYLLTHTIKSEDLTPFLRKLRNWSFRIKTVLNDQCGSVRYGLSVRRRRPRFARPPGAFGPTPADSLRSSADRGSSRSAFGRYVTDGHTQSNLRTSLRSYVTDRSGLKQY